MIWRLEIGGGTPRYDLICCCSESPVDSDCLIQQAVKKNTPGETIIPIINGQDTSHTIPQ